MMRVALVAALLVAAPSIAGAQDCAEGRERVDGRCCWPGQTWSAERARCEGAPRCPEVLVEHGEACLAPAATAFPTRAPGEELDIAGAPVPPVYRASLRAGWPEREALGATELARPVRVRGEDETLIIAAMVVFDVGWIMGWMIPVLEELTGGGCRAFGGGTTGSCNSWPFAFIPVAGGITSGMTNFSGGGRVNFGFGIGLGSPSVILQSVGIIAIAIALANETTEMGYQPLEDEPRTAGARLVPGAPGADAGLSLDVVF